MLLPTLVLCWRVHLLSLSLSRVCFTQYCSCLCSEPPARIYTPPMVPGGLAAVARRTSDMEGTPTPLRVGLGMSTPPRRVLGGRREYSENDLPSNE
jgi:hypothetical protein